MVEIDMKAYYKDEDSWPDNDPRQRKRTVTVKHKCGLYFYDKRYHIDTCPRCGEAL